MDKQTAVGLRLLGIGILGTGIYLLFFLSTPVTWRAGGRPVSGGAHETFAAGMHGMEVSISWKAVPEGRSLSTAVTYTISIHEGEIPLGDPKMETRAIAYARVQRKLRDFLASTSPKGTHTDTLYADLLQHGTARVEFPEREIAARLLDVGGLLVLPFVLVAAAGLLRLLTAARALVGMLLDTPQPRPKPRDELA